MLSKCESIACIYIQVPCSVVNTLHTIYSIGWHVTYVDSRVDLSFKVMIDSILSRQQYGFASN